MQDFRNQSVSEWVNPNNSIVGYSMSEYQVKAFLGDRDLAQNIFYPNPDTDLTFQDVERIALPPDFIGFDTPSVVEEFSQLTPTQRCYQITKWVLLRHDQLFALNNIQKMSYYKGQFVYFMADLTRVNYPGADSRQGYLPWNELHDQDNKIISYVQSWSTSVVDDPYVPLGQSDDRDASAIPDPAPELFSITLTTDYDVSVQSSSKQEGITIGLTSSPDRYIVLRFPAWKIPAHESIQSITLRFTVVSTTVAADSTADIVPISLDPSASVINDLFNDIAGATAYDSTTVMRTTGDKSIELPQSAVTDLLNATDYYSLAIRSDGGVGTAAIAALEHATESATTLVVTYT